MSFEEETTKLVKREDYPNDIEKYWKRVQSVLTHCQIMSAVIVFVVMLFLVFVYGEKVT